MILVIVLIIILLLILASCLKIVPQAHAYVIERLGAYQGTWSVGFHIKMPIIDKVAKKVILKEQVVDFAPQPVITKDNVTMRIDTVVFYQITDPKLYCYGVQNLLPLRKQQDLRLLLKLLELRRNYPLSMMKQE